MARRLRLPGEAEVCVGASTAQRADLGRRLLEPARVTGDEDDSGALGACEPGGLQTDARAAADQDDGLPGQLRLAWAANGFAHQRRFAAWAAIGCLGGGMSAMRMRSAVSAPS